MRSYSLGKGKKKAVGRFTTRHGLPMLAVLTLFLFGIILLWMLGFLRFDID